MFDTRFGLCSIVLRLIFQSITRNRSCYRNRQCANQQQNNVQQCVWSENNWIYSDALLLSVSLHCARTAYNRATFDILCIRWRWQLIVAERQKSGAPEAAGKSSLTVLLLAVSQPHCTFPNGSQVQRWWSASMLAPMKARRVFVRPKRIIQHWVWYTGCSRFSIGCTVVRRASSLCACLKRGTAAFLLMTSKNWLPSTRSLTKACIAIAMLIESKAPWRYSTFTVRQFFE